MLLLILLATAAVAMPYRGDGRFSDGLSSEGLSSEGLSRRGDDLLLHTLAWRNETSYVIREMPIPANGRMPITPNQDELMRIDYEGDPFDAGSSYCTVLVHRTVNGKAERAFPVHMGTRDVGGVTFHMYDFKSVFTSDDVRLTKIIFNVDGDCTYDETTHGT